MENLSVDALLLAIKFLERRDEKAGQDATKQLSALLDRIESQTEHIKRFEDSI